LNLKELKEILQILEEKEITEFELEEQGMKLRIRKGPHSLDHAVARVTPPAPALPQTASPPSLPTLPSDLKVVTSPIVGTFYRAPDANSAPFVNVGDHVRPGQVLCIIEAMKLMNEIEAEVGGEIVRIERENGQPVQYGEPLFAIRPDR
jgi:acetyl-CoA carboxylase biotin carboxyl carrier protein